MRSESVVILRKLSVETHVQLTDADHKVIYELQRSNRDLSQTN